MSRRHHPEEVRGGSRPPGHYGRPLSPYHLSSESSRSRHYREEDRGGSRAPGYYDRPFSPYHHSSGSSRSRHYPPEDSGSSRSRGSSRAPAPYRPYSPQRRSRSTSRHHPEEEDRGSSQDQAHIRPFSPHRRSRSTSRHPPQENRPEEDPREDRGSPEHCPTSPLLLSTRPLHPEEVNSKDVPDSNRNPPPAKTAAAAATADTLVKSTKPSTINWRENTIGMESINFSPFGENLGKPKPYEAFKADVMSTRLRTKLAASSTVTSKQPNATGATASDEQSSTIVLCDTDESNNDDEDFDPTSKRRQPAGRKARKSLSIGNGKRGGRGKGSKNLRPPKQHFEQELFRSQAELERLKAGIITEVKPEQKPQLKPTVKHDFSLALGSVGKVKKPMSKEEVKYELFLSAIEDRFIDQIYDGCVMSKAQVAWSDIGGLVEVKKSMKEMVIDPMRRPDIFTGLRAAPKGVLLYGPPGTGKTLIARCIASQCNSTFFNVSASKLTSKWVGDGEKTVQALFAVARAMQPSVIFIDEVDSILSKRTEKENESSKKMKTEFLVQMEGAATDSNQNDKILVIGATNRPSDLDEAVSRRFQKKILIPLPDLMGRLQILKSIFEKENTSMTEADYDKIAESLDGYSGADIRNVSKEAAMLPVRECGDELDHIALDQIRPIGAEDVMEAAKKIRPTVSSKDLVHYREFDKLFGDKP